MHATVWKMSVVISREQEHRLFDVNTEDKVCSRRRGSLRCLGMQQRRRMRGCQGTDTLQVMQLLIAPDFSKRSMHVSFDTGGSSKSFPDVCILYAHCTPIKL